MWRKRRGSLGGGSAARDSPSLINSNSLLNTPSSMSITSSSPFFGSDPNANDRALVFRVEVPTPGPLGLDLRARHIERDKPQRGAVVKGFRPLAGDQPGYVESTGRVKVGDILQVLHKTAVDDMPFEHIVKHAMQLQQDSTAWPLAIEFRREPERHEANHSVSSKPRRNSFFRSSISMSNPVQDGNFNEKLQYFRYFFATRIPTGGATPKEKEKPPRPPKWDTVDEMYRELMLKRGVPEDVMDELIRIESLETKWHVVWYAQQNENDEYSKSSATEAEKFAENLVELKWDNKGMKDLEALRAKIAIASTDWLEAFLAHFGLDYLTMKLPDPSPFPIENSKYEKATRVCEVILRILRSLTHFAAGVEAMTNTPGLVKRVALCFHTDNGDLKKNTLQLLGIVCYNSAAGHSAVIEAFDQYKETKGESIRFSCLRDALKSTRYSLVFKEDVLSFVNIIVNKAIRLEDRLAIRSDFMALKMAGYFEEIRAKSLAVQRTKYPLASSAATTSPNEGFYGAASPSPGAPATPSPIPLKHIARSNLSPVLSARLTDSPESGRGIGPGTPVRKLDTLKALGGRHSITSKSVADYSAGRLSASKSAPPSPIDRDLAALSPDGAIARSSLPLDNRSGARFAIGGNSIISSSVTQLRNQLDNMEKQIDVFEQFMEDDRKDTIYEQTDLASLDSVFRSLSDSVATDQELQACLLSILQQLLFIPGDRVIGKEMWALSEKVMKQITLLAPVEEVRKFELGYDDRKTLLKMRDQYAQFLQKCADQDPTFQFRMGPIILMENNRNHDELALSDATADETDEEDAASSVVARDHSDLAKYFKLLKMGMPLQQVQQKMSGELQAFDPSILETPDKVIQLMKPDNDLGKKNGTRAKEHEKFAKFFKLKKMGMPMAHIQLKMSADGLDSLILESPDLLLDRDGNEVKVGSHDSSFAGVPVKEHAKYAKFFKLLKMGMSLEHIQLKVSAEGLDASLLSTPNQLLDEEGKIFRARQSKQSFEGIPVKEHEKFAKFFKLIKMGMPLEHIKIKAVAEGLNAELLSTPDALVSEDGSLVVAPISRPAIKVIEHEKFAKFFKLLEIGMPIEQVKVKASAEGLDGGLLDTPDVLVDEDGKLVKPLRSPGIRVKDHEKFAKFFKLLEMGMPLEHVKVKVGSEGLDVNLLESPDKLVDEDGNEIQSEAQVSKQTPVKDHEKFAKLFKLLKMGMPLPQVKLKAAAEGLDGELLETPDVLVDEEGKVIKACGEKKVKACEHLQYVKYFKLLKLGMPRAQLELRMTAESLDSKVLDTPNALILEHASPAVRTAVQQPVVVGPPKPKLRNLYWEAVKSEETSGTIWELFAKEEETKSKEKVATVNAPSAKAKVVVVKKDVVLDKFVDQLSDIFVNKSMKEKESEAKIPTQHRAPTRVALIDAKRANNIGIMLARFRLPYHKLRNAVLLVDKELLSVERVSSLLQFAPEDEELDAVRGYTGDIKLLGDAEQYFREMECVPRLTTRLQAIHATWQFDAYVEEQRKLMASVSNACCELQKCGLLKEIFRVVLSLGNALNDGTARGGAKGFKLNILLKLNQVKAADNSINLLNYVAKVLRAKNPSILEFDKSLPSIESASRVTIQMLKAGESAVQKAANLISNELEVHAKLPEKKYSQPDSEEEISDRFQEVVKPFADRAKKASEQITEDMGTMIKRFEKTTLFYGEDPTSPDCGPDAFFSIFYSFAKVLQSADRDNERKRIAEERKVRREEETKKRLEQLKLKKKKSTFATLKTGDVNDIVSKIRAKRVEEKRREILAANGSAPPSSTGSNRGSASALRSSNNAVPTPAMDAV